MFLCDYLKVSSILPADTKCFIKYSWDLNNPKTGTESNIVCLILKGIHTLRTDTQKDTQMDSVCMN